MVLGGLLRERASWWDADEDCGTESGFAPTRLAFHLPRPTRAGLCDGHQQHPVLHHVFLVSQCRSEGFLDATTVLFSSFRTSYSYDMEFDREKIAVPESR